MKCLRRQRRIESFYNLGYTHNFVLEILCVTFSMSEVEIKKLKFGDLNVSDSLNYREIAGKMQGFSGSDINNFSRMAATENMRKVTKGLSSDAIKKLDQKLALTPVTMEDCHLALSKIKKTVTSKELDVYNAWNKEHGSTEFKQ